VASLRDARSTTAGRAAQELLDLDDLGAVEPVAAVELLDDLDAVMTSVAAERLCCSWPWCERFGAGEDTGNRSARPGG
jgi:hypothetical protein